MSWIVYRDREIAVEDYWEESRGITVFYYFTDSNPQADLLEFWMDWEVLESYCKDEYGFTCTLEHYDIFHQILSQREMRLPFETWWREQHYHHQLNMLKVYLNKYIIMPQLQVNMEGLLRRKAV